MKAFAFGVFIAWAVEAFFLMLLVDWTTLQYPENDALAIVGVGIGMGLFTGFVCWGFSKVEP